MTDTRSTYTVRLHTGKELPASMTDRLTTISYKATAANAGRKPPTRSVSLPRVTLTVSPACLATAMQEAFERIQDARIRELIDESVETSGNPAWTGEISAAELTPEALAAWSASKSTGDRLTKQDILDWFNAALSDQLTLALADKLAPGNPNPEPAVLTAITATHDQFRTVLTGLAAPKVSLPDNIRSQLLKALALADTTINPRIHDKLTAKLTSTPDTIKLAEML